MKLTEVSQSTLQSLIELQSEVVTSTLTAVAKRLERAASAEGVTDLVFDQIEMLPATRDRIVDEAIVNEPLGDRKLSLMVKAPSLKIAARKPSVLMCATAPTMLLCSI